MIDLQFTVVLFDQLAVLSFCTLQNVKRKQIGFDISERAI